MLTHAIKVTLFLDITGTCRSEIKLAELFKTEADHFTLVVPCVLKVVWLEQLSSRVLVLHQPPPFYRHGHYGPLCYGTLFDLDQRNR
jgi:hypothetical protein